MKILFICTSNKDRSPALQNYFERIYPAHEYKSAGINKYFCEKKETHFLEEADIKWADVIVYAENIHWDITHRRFNTGQCREIILSCGEYSQGCIGEDYLTRAEEIMITRIENL